MIFNNFHKLLEEVNGKKCAVKVAGDGMCRDKACLDSTHAMSLYAPCLYTIFAPDIRRFPFDVCLFLFVDFDILRKLIFISKIVVSNA